MCYYGDSIDVFHQLMQGMEHHLTNPVIDQRVLAMRLAERISQKIIKDGSPLKFDVCKMTMWLYHVSFTTDR